MTGARWGVRLRRRFERTRLSLISWRSMGGGGMRKSRLEARFLELGWEWEGMLLVQVLVLQEREREEYEVFSAVFLVLN